MNILNLRPVRFRVAVLFLVPFLTIAFLSPAMADRPGNRAKRNNARMQRKAPQRAQRPAPTVQRQQRRQVTRSPQRQQRRQVTRPQRQQRQQVTRSPQRQQRRQVTRSPQRQQRQQVTRSPQRRQRQQVTRSPQRQQRQQVTRSPQRQQRQQVTRSPQRQQRQRFTNSPRRQERQKMTRSPQRQERQKMTRGPQRQERQKMTRGPQRQERQKMTRSPQRQERQKVTRGPQRQERQKMTRGPQRQERQKMTRGSQRQDRQRMTNRPQRGQDDRRGKRVDDRRPNRGYANRDQRPGRNANGVSFTRPGRIDTRKTRAAQQVVRQPIATGARRGGTANFNRNRNYNANVNQNQNYNYNYNQNVNVNRNVVVSQPAAYTYAAPNVCPPAYSVVRNYNPYAYANYCDRRDYRRRYRNNCNWPLLILGFFISRPYSSYDYARVDYNNQPYFYGDDTAYQASPVAVGSEGGPVAATPNFDSKEEQMLVALSEHVQARTADGAYQISDAAFNGQLWNLDLAQAPAVFEIQEGLYSVVAGFEGTLGAGEVPSNVNVEFFIARTANGYEVRDAWITSANGIPRNRLYQSPVYPDVSTWEPGRLCPFTGQEMVPMEAHTSEHG